MERVIKGRILRFGENVQHRILRPAWTSTQMTGLFESHKHRHGRDLELGFYERSSGFFRNYDKNATIRPKETTHEKK